MDKFKTIVITGYFLWWIVGLLSLFTNIFYYHYHSNVAGGVQLAFFLSISVVLFFICYALLSIGNKEIYKRVLFLPWLLLGFYVLAILIKIKLFG